MENAKKIGAIRKKIEGREFNYANQIKYQILLIQNKLYKPTELSKEQEGYFYNIEKKMPFALAKDIFNAQNYKDPAMRGRNSAAPLNKMGLCIAKNSAEAVKITPLGEYFLSDSYDLGRLFFIHFLKWQLPNPTSIAFSDKDGFAIKPFIGTLHLINEANKIWLKTGNNRIGISKEEFSIFVPTLINYKDIKNQANKLIEYRLGLRLQKDDKSRKKFQDEFINNFLKKFLEKNQDFGIEKLTKNLKDYGDNTIRYFRLTRFLYIRGGGFYIDLEQRRQVEINKLLLTDNAAPLEFDKAYRYIEYLADIKQPILPWETKTALEEIAGNLTYDIKNYISDLKSNNIKTPFFDFQKTEGLDMEQLRSYIGNLRGYRLKLHAVEARFKAQSISEISEYIEALKNIHQSNNKKSVELEKLSTLALNALNDAIEIKPNYPVGDDNEPTFTAPANRPDIECFYKKFNSVCEVTMLTTRSQWYNEGQPVMRHVREFERRHAKKNVYCLFIAPRLHQDTIETFWMAIKYGYRGEKQKIVPLSISQFIKLLETLLEIKTQGGNFTHDELLALYKLIIELTDYVKHSEEWIKQIPETIAKWRQSILARR